MAVTESRRHELHKELRTKLGEPVADTLMEYLPPNGWSDVARTSDVRLVQADVEHLRTDMDTRFAHVDKRLDGLVHGMWALAGIFSAAFIALFTLIATKG